MHRHCNAAVTTTVANDCWLVALLLLSASLSKLGIDSFVIDLFINLLIILLFVYYYKRLSVCCRGCYREKVSWLVGWRCFANVFLVLAYLLLLL